MKNHWLTFNLQKQDKQNPVLKNLMLLLVILISFAACKSDDCNNLKEKTEDQFNTAYAVIMPFSGNETVKYLKNNTDTVDFVGQGKQKGFIKENEPSEPCPIVYNCLYHKVIFKAYSGESIEIMYYKNVVGYNTVHDYFDVSFSNTFSNRHIIKELSPYLIGSASQSKTILGKVYSDCYGFSRNTKDSIYFNLPENARTSIIRITYEGALYELIPEP